MITISLCMIVRNEEYVIERCLKSAGDIADEIIIVDTGSSDETERICSRFTNKIYHFQWIDDFSVARNYSFSKASMDYILWLDADDVLLEEDRRKFTAMKKNLDSSTDSVTMLYNLGAAEHGKPELIYRRNRLVKRINNFKWHGAVHEYLEVSGKILNSDVAVTHKKVKATDDRNINIYKKRLENGEEFTPRDVFYYANELFEHNFMEEAVEYYKKALLIETWYEDKIRACGKISDYYSSKGNYASARDFAFRSFEYDLPRAEFCCRIGFSFLSQNKINEAIFWYELAIDIKKPENSWGFFEEACWTWVPHMQLCVCYDRLGNYRLAFEHNKIAEEYLPNDQRILYNKKYFETLGFQDKI